MKPWYQCTVAGTQAYFDTDISNGLVAGSVFARLKRFGKNLDLSLSPEVGRVCKATVIREGRSQIVSLQHVVPGDVVSLKPGDRVPADLRLFKVEHLEIDESMLGTNGLPTAKNTYAIDKTTPLNKQKCIAFNGTFVVKGQGLGIVVAHADDVAYRPPIKKQARSNIKNSLIARRLHRHGIAIGRHQDISNLPKIKVLFLDVELSDKDVTELIRKIQLIKKIPCKFLVAETQAKRLQSELIGAEMVEANKLAKLTSKYLVSAINDAQFIINAAPANTLKIVKALNDDGVKTMWVSDGQRPMPAMQITAVSLVVGNLARDDVLSRASLIMPSAGVSLLASIFYNTK